MKNAENIERTVEILNNLILQSVNHGADLGGSYANNTEELEKAVNDAIEHFGLTEYKISWDGECTPIIIPV